MRDLIALFWVADIMDLPFMEMFDTTYPLNTAFWFIGWFVLAGLQSSVTVRK
jgi:hypothetical protein